LYLILLYITPVGLVVKIGVATKAPGATTRIAGIQYWLKEGAKVGVEWSRISALFSGGEELCFRLRYP
jgi:hypothetical protein